MPVTVKLFDREGVTGDAREIQSRDQWIVSTDAPSSSDTSNPTGVAARAAGLPPLFTAGVRPDAPTLLADCYESCRTLDGQIGKEWMVTIRYSSTGRFRFPPTRDKTNVSFKTTQDSSSHRVVEVPYFSVLRVAATPQPGVLPPPTDTAPRLKYVKGVRRFDLAQSNPQLRVNVNGFSFQDREKILKQLNKYHRMDFNNTGPLFKFVSYVVAEHAENLWSIVYQWIQDPGGPSKTVWSSLPASITYADGAVLDPASPITTLLAPVSRGPFENYVVIPSQDGNIRPKIITIPEYASDDITGYAGAHALPGAPV